jgi:hypothetical protein
MVDPCGERHRAIVLEAHAQLTTGMDTSMRCQQNTPTSQTLSTYICVFGWMLTIEPPAGFLDLTTRCMVFESGFPYQRDQFYSSIMQRQSSCRSPSKTIEPPNLDNHWTCPYQFHHCFPESAIYDHGRRFGDSSRSLVMVHIRI